MPEVRSFRKVVLAVVVLGLGIPAPVAVAAAGEDCRVEPPPAGATTELPADRRPTNTLGDKLAACGSVLDPPRVGDPDIVEPAPRTGDPINLHPGPQDEDRP